MDGWIARGLKQAANGELEQIVHTNDHGHEVLAAEGYEFERLCWTRPGESAWRERVLVVRLPAHAARQAAGLETRLSQAENKLAALTPPARAGETADHRRSDALSSHRQRTPHPSSRRFAVCGLGKASRAADPLR